MIISLHHDDITSYFEKISNHKPLANQYNRKKKPFQQNQEIEKKFRKITEMLDQILLFAVTLTKIYK